VGRPTDDVYMTLKTDIMHGRLAPGAHLVEETIGQQFNVSRTPIRNAIKRLEDEGLVFVESRRGAFVASWTSADAAEVMAIRSMLEAQAAALAAERRTPEDLEYLAGICDKMEGVEETRAADFRDRMAHYNHEFHIGILQVARSPRLFNICKNLTLAPLMSGSFQAYDEHHLHRSLWDHRAILTSIRLQDEESARAMMAAHLRITYQFMSNRDNSTDDISA